MVKQIQSESSDTWHYCYSLKDIKFWNRIGTSDFRYENFQYRINEKI